MKNWPDIEDPFHESLHFRLVRWAASGRRERSRGSTHASRASRRDVEAYVVRSTMKARTPRRGLTSHPRRLCTRTFSHLRI